MLQISLLPFGAHRSSATGFALLSILLFALFMAPAQAQMAQNLFIGNPKALALGHAVTADPPGIDSIHFNPAGLSRLDGRQVEVKFLAAIASLEADFSPSDEYSEVLRTLNYTDPIVTNNHSEIEGVSAMLPFLGVVDLPVPGVAAAIGGVSFAPPKSRFTFANAVYAPIILGFHRDENDPGTHSAEQVGLTRLTYFSPSFAFQVSDTLSIGGSLGLNYMGLGLKIDMRLPNPIIAGLDVGFSAYCDIFPGETGDIVRQFLDLCGGSFNPVEGGLAVLEVELEDYFSPTYNLGLLWEPTDWLAFGAVYQSGVTDRLKGDYKVTYSEGVSNFFDGLDDSAIGNFARQVLGIPDDVTQDTGAGQIDLTYPQHAAIGMSLKVTPRLKVNLDVKYTDVEVWDEFLFEFGTPVTFFEFLGVFAGPNLSGDFLRIPRGYQSVTTWAMGVEYQYSDRLALRFGYEPRKSAIPDDKRDLILPLGEMDLFAFGFSYKWKPGTVVDAAFTIVRSEQNIPDGTSTNVNTLGAQNFIYNPYTGHNLETDLTVGLFELSYRTYF